MQVDLAGPRDDKKDEQKSDGPQPANRPGAVRGRLAPGGNQSRWRQGRLDGGRGMFDLKRTVALLKGMAVQPRATWEAYYPERRLAKDLRPADRTADRQHRHHRVGPCLSIRQRWNWLGGVLTQIILLAIWTAVLTGGMRRLAQVFNGKGDFAHSLAAVSLATVPGWTGGAVVPVPGIGSVLSLGFVIYAGVLLYQIMPLYYQIMPLYLKVPERSRSNHFLVSIGVAALAGALLASTLATSATAPVAIDEHDIVLDAEASERAAGEGQIVDEDQAIYAATPGSSMISLGMTPSMSVWA